MTSRRLALGAAAMLMLVLVALVYAPVKEAGFLWDDHALVERDAAYRHTSLRELFTRPFWPETPQADARAGNYYRPLVLVSFRADLAFAAWESPDQFHTTNIILHIIAATLVAVCAFRLGARGLAASLAGVGWALAPRVAESVAWIAGRTDLLALVFGLAALVLWPDKDARRPWPRVIVSAVLLLLALFAKEVALAAAVALVWRARDKKQVAAGIGAPVGIYLVLRTLALGGVLPSGREQDASERTMVVFEAVGRYAEMIATPFSPQTSIGAIGALDTARVVVGVLVVIALVLLAVRVRRAQEGLRAAFALGVVSLLAASQIVPISAAGAVVADRYLTWPLAGIAIGISIFASRATGRTAHAFAFAALAFAVVAAFVTRHRLGDYADEPRFWTVAAEKAHPANSNPRTALANVVRDYGRTPLACRLFEASRRRALRGSPSSRRAGEGLGTCLARSGRYDEAVALFQELAREHPQSGRIVMGLGFVRLHLAEFDAAEAAFAKAVELDPRVRKTVDSARLAIASARMYHADEGKLTRARRAEYLSLIGRLPDAERAYAAIAADPTETDNNRRGSLFFLVPHGTPEVARAALVACAGIFDPDFDAMLRAREARVAKVDRLLPRIEALAAQ